MTAYNLDLFRQLNAEYAPKPTISKAIAPKYDPQSLLYRARKRAEMLREIFPLEGQRILEVGCGRGEVCRAMAEHFGANVTGVDIEGYAEWKTIPSTNVDFHQIDLAKQDLTDGAQFDHACSFAVWEHVRHPFSLLKKVHSLLKPGGRFYLIANLYRGPSASHRYRDVFFPWPHLLFSDEVFKEFFVSIGKEPMGADWVNQLSIADYYHYFSLIGFKIESVRFDVKPIDEEFYSRFEDRLGRFPRFDLEKDFIKVVLVKDAEAKPSL